MSSSTVATPSKTTDVPARQPGQPLLPSEVEFDKIGYTDLKQMGNGPAKTCYVNYVDGGKLLVELPWMTTYDGIRQPPPEYRDEGAPPKYSIDFSLKGYRGENLEVKELSDFLEGFQNKLIQDSCVNSMQWHKKTKMTPEVAEAILTPLLKISTDKNTGEVLDQYPPKFKIKVPFWEGEWKCDVFKSGNRNPIEGDLSEQVCGRMDARAIVACSGLWFAGGKFGVSWKLVQMEYRTIEQAELASYAFREPTPLCEDSDHDNEENTVRATAGEEVNDDDEDEVVDSDVE